MVYRRYRAINYGAVSAFKKRWSARRSVARRTRSQQLYAGLYGLKRNAYRRSGRYAKRRAYNIMYAARKRRRIRTYS